MASSEVMTSSPHSFACSYRLVKKCFVKICETLKCHNFLIFQPIFIRFSLLSLKIFTLFSEIKLNLFRISPLKPYPSHYKVYRANVCPTVWCNFGVRSRKLSFVHDMFDICTLYLLAFHRSSQN